VVDTALAQKELEIQKDQQRAWSRGLNNGRGLEGSIIEEIKSRGSQWVSSDLHLHDSLPSEACGQLEGAEILSLLCILVIC